MACHLRRHFFESSTLRLGKPFDDFFRRFLPSPLLPLQLPIAVGSVIFGGRSPFFLATCASRREARVKLSERKSP